MNLVIIFGPLAVGKMTVGQELEKITALKVCHNHMTIEMVLPFFDMKSASFKRLVNSFRTQLLEEVAKSNLDGLIFTYVWELDSKSDCDFIDRIVKIFKQANATVCYVELEAGPEVRLKRNQSPNRLRCKPSKRNLEASELELIETDRKHILNTKNDDFMRDSHFKIDNTNLDAVEVAEMIKRRFELND